MEELKRRLDERIQSLEKNRQIEIKERLTSANFVFPFNRFEYVLFCLLRWGKITFEEYQELRDEYIMRNKYLYLFEITAPRSFGERWGQTHLQELEPKLLKPSKVLDRSYSGQYDLIYFHQELNRTVKIEVKASRAVAGATAVPLYEKALSSSDRKKFDMNYQQIKPRCCDVFVWIGVWRDKIRYWVLSSEDVENNSNFSSGQHRGNKGEGQLHLTSENIHEFDEYEVDGHEILQAILSAYGRQNRKSGGELPGLFTLGL